MSMRRMDLGWMLAALGLLTPGCLGGSAGADDDEPDPNASADGEGEGGEDPDGDGGEDSGGDGSEEPWEPDGPSGECAVDELMPPHVYVRRVKTLLTGAAATDEEVAAVVANPEVLADLIAGWVQTDAFSDKLAQYLRVTLQQAPGGRTEYVSQIANADGIGQFRPPNALFDNLDEMFVRTALKIVEEGRPFTEIASTRSWMMTTGVMAYLLLADQRDWGSTTYYGGTYSSGGINYSASTPMATQIANMTFHVDYEAGSGCGVESSNNETRLFTRMMGSFAGNQNDPCNAGIDGLFDASDFDDWREVELSTLPEGESLLRFYDAPTLRSTTTLALRSSKAGFFSAPAFLAGWRSNEDNSFRVTTNQSLIVALGLAFEDTDVTTPLGDEGLAEGHADPSTQCYACHKNLDPMRNFFDNVYYPDSYAVRTAQDMPGLEASFSFQGHSSPGETLADFGQIVSEHPGFASGWTQKLCYLANSQGCDTSDPEFARVAGAFADSNYDFKTLVVELFSSPLVTGADCPDGVPMTMVPSSTTRREHLCALLEQRLGQDACNLSDTTRNLAAALPADAWARGSDVPNQPTQSSLFYAATTESLCREIGEEYVDAEGSLLQSADLEVAVDVLVEQVMGVATSDPRHASTHGLLSTHLLDAATVTDDATKQLVSAFVLACTSPYITSTDF
ncbi:MAG: hypothetical protein AB1Z98_32185 [Nannocystaceae bacterium]